MLMHRFARNRWDVHLVLLARSVSVNKRDTGYTRTSGRSDLTASWVVRTLATQVPRHEAFKSTSKATRSSHWQKEQETTSIHFYPLSVFVTAPATTSAIFSRWSSSARIGRSIAIDETFYVSLTSLKFFRMSSCYGFSPLARPSLNRLKLYGERLEVDVDVSFGYFASSNLCV